MSNTEEHVEAHENGGVHQKDYQHLYSAHQTPKPLLQTPQTAESSPFTAALLSKAVGRAKEAESTLKAMMKGERPPLGSGGGRGAKWLRKRVEVASGDGSLPQPPTAYYTLPHSNSQIGYNPAPYALLEGAQEVEELLSKHNVTVRMIGTRRHLPESQIKSLQRNSDVLIALPGDLKADYELTEVIRRKLEGARLAPLIIENNGNLLDPVLANIQLLEYRNRAANPDERRAFVNFDKLARSYGIYITHDRTETLELAENLNKAQLKQGEAKREPYETKPLIPDGATIFVATATRKKYRELTEIYELQGLKVNILPIDLLVDGYISPKEESGSYEGNAAEKIRAAFDAWDRMKPETQVERLKSLGKRLHDMGRGEDTYLLNAPLPGEENGSGIPGAEKSVPALEEEKIFFLAEDSGFHFAQTNPENGLNLSTEMEFADIANKIDPRAPFPGVETGPGILGNYGVSNFFNNVGQILTRYAERGHPTTRDVVKKSVLALAQLQPHPGTYDAHIKDKAKKIVMYASETRGHFINSPRPSNNSVDIDNFLIPAGSNKTEAELGVGWTATRSPRALAWQGLVYDQQIGKELQTKRKPLREKDYRVGIVYDNSHEVAKAAIQRLVALNRLPEFQVDQVDAEVKQLSDVQTKMLEGRDAIILAFDPERAQMDFWRNVWTFSSLFVGEQTRDKYKLEKPLYLINPKDDKQVGPFDYLEALTHDLHMLGTIAQDPKTVYHSVQTADEAIEGIKQYRDNYLRYDPPEYSKGPKIEPTGDESQKDFNVAIFVSATNENDMVRGVSKHLASQLAKENFGVVTGAGLYSGMGSITKTMVEIRDEHDAHHTGYNVPHIMDGGEVRGKNIVELVDRFHLCRDIYERIEGMLSADAAIVAPGGMGTVQELAGFALLKDLALKNPDDPYTKDFLSKELVIINSPIETGSERRGFYDMLIQVIPPQDFKRLGIHVVQDAEEAIDKMRELREKKRATHHATTSETAPNFY